MSELLRKRPLTAVAIIAIVLVAAITITFPPQAQGEFRSFSSYYQLSAFVLQRTRDYSSYLNQVYGPVRMESTQAGLLPAQSATSFTATNVQVEGVDEPDIVKTDGTYLYAVSQNRVFLILAYPPDQARIVSKLDFLGSVAGIFVSQDRLVVIENGDTYVQQEGFYGPVFNLRIYDISDRTTPTVLKVVSLPGSYINSRLTAGYIYAVVQQAAVQVETSGALKVSLPTMYKDGVRETLPLSKIYYNPISKAPVNIYTLVLWVRIADGASNTISVLTGMGSTIYASFSNIYLTYPEYPIVYLREGVVATQWSSPSIFAPALWGGYSDNTTIFRVAISADRVEVAATGSVPGQILNQFSLDEYGGYFRVATTSFRSEYDGSSVQVNNVFVLDEKLNIVGSLQGLASKERIYAVRFLGNRAYMVTFEKIDPLFAISFDDPRQPKILNELKMPGFSQYLHPIQGGYLIGVGKDAVPAEEGGFAWYQGLKLSLFHADDDGNLTEVAKLLIGDRGSETPVLYEHKAFTYDPQRNIMALPILLAEINKNGYVGTPPPNSYGDLVWQGAYIFQVSTQGFVQIGNVTHIPQGGPIAESYGFFVNRIVLIGDFVYTISDGIIEVNAIQTMAGVAELRLQA